MAYVVDPSTAVRHRLVFELRYERGELYWDRCGRVARAVANREGWATNVIDANGCHIRNEDDNLVFSFSSTGVSLTQTQNRDVQEVLPADRFAALAEELSEMVVAALEVDALPRMGFRTWTLYPTASLDDATLRVSRMSFFAACSALTDLGELSYPSHSVVIARPDRMVRVAVTPFEQQVNLAPSLLAAARQRAHEHWQDQRKVLIEKLKAQRAIKAYPSLGIMVDMDAYIEDVPSAKQIPICQFVNGATRDFGSIAQAILVEVDR